MGIILDITTKKSDLNITTEHFQGVKSAKSIKIAFADSLVILAADERTRFALPLFAVAGGRALISVGSRARSW